MVFVTARVHPGETPGSYMLDGLLESVLSPTERGYLLRRNFVFKVIPILNPDGVYRGHYRLDARGFNLNRCYVYPSPDEYPVIYATKAYIDYLHSEHSLLFYLDLHAQPSRPSSFLFGNHQDLEGQVESQLFARLMSLLTPLFTYHYCDFSERSMKTKDPKDHHSKEGCGRVAVHRSTGLAHCYTIECCYEAGRCLLPKPSLPFRKLREVSPGPSFQSDIPAYREIGAALGNALLTFYNHIPLIGEDLGAIRALVKDQVTAEKNKPKLSRKGSYRQRSKEDLKKPDKSSSIRSKPTPRALHPLKLVSPDLRPEKVARLPPIAPRRTLPLKSKRLTSVESKQRKRLPV